MVKFSEMSKDEEVELVRALSHILDQDDGLGEQTNDER